MPASTLACPPSASYLKQLVKESIDKGKFEQTANSTGMPLSKALGTASASDRPKLGKNKLLIYVADIKP